MTDNRATQMRDLETSRLQISQTAVEQNCSTGTYGTERTTRILLTTDPAAQRYRASIQCSSYVCMYAEYDDRYVCRLNTQ